MLLSTLWTWITTKLGALTSITAGGAWAFSSATRPTSAATTDTLAAANASSLITKGDGDLRYGKISAYLSADLAAIQSQIAYQSSTLSIALPAGIWQIDGLVIATNVTSSAGLKSRITSSGGSVTTYRGESRLTNSVINISDVLGEAGQTSGLAPHRSFLGLVNVTTATTLTLQYAQQNSTAADTILRGGTYLIASRIA
jgi:hypothetical protein